jgi:hypothetical protein
MALTPGTTLGPYSVTPKIGEGGIGQVWRDAGVTVDNSCWRPVAAGD